MQFNKETCRELHLGENSQLHENGTGRGGPGRVLQKDMVSSKSHLRPNAHGGADGIGVVPSLPTTGLCELASCDPVLQPHKQYEFVGRSRQLQLGFTSGFALVCAFGAGVQNCSPGFRWRYSTPRSRQAVQKTSSGTDCCLPGLTQCSCTVRFFILAAQKSIAAVGFMLLVILSGCCPECSIAACLKSVA